MSLRKQAFACEEGFYMYASEDLMLSSKHVKLNNPTIVAYL